MTIVLIIAIVAVMSIALYYISYLNHKEIIKSIASSANIDKSDQATERNKELEEINDFLYEVTGHKHTRLLFAKSIGFIVNVNGANTVHGNFQYATEGGLQLVFDDISAKIFMNEEEIVSVHGKHGDIIPLFRLDSDRDKEISIGFKEDGEPYIYEDKLTQLPFDLIYGITVHQIRKLITDNPNDVLTFNLVGNHNLKFTASEIKDFAIKSRLKEDSDEELVVIVDMENGDDYVIPLLNIESGELPGDVKFRKASNLAYGYFQSLN